MTRGARLTIFAVTFALCLVIGALAADVTHSAPARSDRRGICQVGHAQDTCWSPAKAAREFRHGHYRRSHGFPARRVWANPTAARTVWVHKIKSYLDHHPGTRRAVRRHLEAAGATPLLDGTCAGAATASDYCLAWETYGNLMAFANCVGYAEPSGDPHACQWGGEGPITKKGIQRGGALVFCGGAVVIGVLGSAGTDGGASPAVVGIWGGLGCGWSFWSSFH